MTESLALRKKNECATPWATPAFAEWVIGRPAAVDSLEQGDQITEASGKRRGKTSAEVSPKIGAFENGDFNQVASNTQRIREDNQARARCIHERQLYDTVGTLLGDPNQQSNVAVVGPNVGKYRESSAGRFLYRARDTGNRYEVEAQLPGGRLIRVLRNPLRRTITFEGEVLLPAGHPKETLEERLVVRIPPGFDLAGPPAHVERCFQEGRCFVACQRTSGS